MDKEKVSTECGERRYQWGISVVLTLMGFFSGVIFQTERMSEQLVTNTVEVRIIKESLRDIQAKLDMIISGRQDKYQ